MTACANGHALIRVWNKKLKCWQLACVHCPYRISE